MDLKIGKYFSRLSSEFNDARDEIKTLKKREQVGIVALSIFAGFLTFGLGGVVTFNSLVGRFKKANENKKKPITERSTDVGNQVLSGTPGSKDKTPPAATPTPSTATPTPKATPTLKATPTPKATAAQSREVKKLKDSIEPAQGKVELLDLVLKSEMSSVQDRLDALKTIALTSKELPTFTPPQLRTAKRLARDIKNPELKKEASSIVDFIEKYNKDPYLQKNGEAIAEIFCVLHEEMEKAVVLSVDFPIGETESMSENSSASELVFLAEDDEPQIVPESQLAASLPEETAKGFETFSSKNLNDYQGLFTFILALKAKPDIDNVKLRLAKSFVREDQKVVPEAIEKVEILEDINKLVDDVESIKKEISSPFLLDLVGKKKKEKSGMDKFLAFSKLVQNQINLKRKIVSSEGLITNLGSKLAADKVVELTEIAAELEKQKMLFDKTLSYDLNEILRTYVQMRDDLMKPGEDGKSDFALLTDDELDEYEDILNFVQYIVVLKSKKPEIDVSTQVKGLIDGDTNSEVSMDKVELSLLKDEKFLNGVKQVKNETKRKAEAKVAQEKRIAREKAVREKEYTQKNKDQLAEASSLGTALTEPRVPSPVRKKDQGIPNIHNSCYMNAALQVILNSSIGEKSKGIQPPNPFNVDEENTLYSEVLKLMSEFEEEMINPIDEKLFIEKFNKIEGEIFNEDSTLKILNKNVLELYRDLSGRIITNKWVDDLTSIKGKNVKVKQLFNQLEHHNKAREKVKINLAALKLFKDVYDGQLVLDSKNKTITLERAAKYLRLVTKNPETSLCLEIAQQSLTKQEDAQEYMQGVLEALGYGFNVGTVMSAGEDKSQRVYFSGMIHLPLANEKKTLKELIKAYCVETINDAINAWKVEMPGGDAHYHAKYKQTRSIVGEIPEQIVIQLNRFDYTFGVPKKIDREITIPDVLDLGSLIDDSLKDEGISTRYRLKAYVYHSGGVSGGHYTANAKVNDKWMHYDDRRAISGEDKHRNKSYIYVFERIK